MEYFKRKRKGFNGVTHLIIGVLIFTIVYLMPTFAIEAIKPYIIHITSGVPIFLITFFIITGGSLFPDLDSKRSTAMFRLGTTGRFLNMFMIKSGSAIWKIYHLKRDKRPGMYHRVIYHTPAFVALFAFIFSLAPSGKEVILGSFLETKVKHIPSFVHENVVVFLIIVTAHWMMRLSISTLLYKPFKKLFRQQFISNTVSLIITSVFTFYVCTLSLTDIKMIGITVVIGYSSHLIGDLFTRGSIPLLWPIPIKGEVYHRPRLFFQVSTDEGPAQIVNRVLIVSIFFLFVLILVRGTQL